MVVFSVSVILAACSGASRDETLGWSADRLYTEAQSELKASNYEVAVGYFQKLESRYPFGQYAQQALLSSAYAQWKAYQPADALTTLDRFERLYPNHPNLDYVLYLRGLVNFNDRETLFSRLTGEDLAERDPAAALAAFDQFKQLVDRFPKSVYAPDAQLRLTYLVNTLAMNDVHVARYYLRRGAFLAGVNRAKTVLENYQNTTAVEEALAQMVYGYDKLGMADLRDDSRRVLQASFPQSLFLKRTYNPSDKQMAEANTPAPSKGFFSNLLDKLPSFF